MSAITLHKGHQARVFTMALSIIWTSCWRSVLGFSREGGLLSEAGHSTFGHVCRKDRPVLDWNLCPWIEEADLLPQLSPLTIGLMGFPRAPLSWKDRPYFITANCPWDQSKERGSSKALKTWLGCCIPCYILVLFSKASRSSITIETLITKWLWKSLVWLNLSVPPSVNFIHP